MIPIKIALPTLKRTIIQAHITPTAAFDTNFWKVMIYIVLVLLERVVIFILGAVISVTFKLDFYVQVSIW